MRTFVVICLVAYVSGLVALAIYSHEILALILFFMMVLYLVHVEVRLNTTSQELQALLYAFKLKYLTDQQENKTH